MRKLVRYVKFYIRDRSVRHNVAILSGIIFNGFYIIFNLISGIVYKNAWFVAVGAYYAIIALLRYSVFETPGESIGSQASYKALADAGRLMLLVSIPMTGMIIYTVISHRHAEYPYPVLAVFTVYTVYSVARCVYRIFLSKKEKSTSLRAAYKMRLIVALLSVFNLQSAIVSSLDISVDLATLLNFLTGAIASVSTLAIAGRALTEGKKRCRMIKMFLDGHESFAQGGIL